MRPASRNLVALGLVAVVFAAYGGVRGNGWVNFDDAAYVSGNPHVRPGLTLDGVRWACSTWHASNWHPLTWISHMLDCSLWGLDPAGHHWTSVFLHAASVLLLLLLLLRWTAALWPSALAAALFAVHPLHVESVAWIAERKDVLSGLFALATLTAYSAHVTRPTPLRYALTTALFAAGLLAKPMLVTLPCLMLLIDFWPLERPKPSAIEKLPWFALAALSSLVTFLAQRGGGAVGTFQEIPLPARLANAVVSYSTYLRLALWPADLAVFYPHPAVVSGGYAAWRVAGALVVLLAISWAAWGLRRRGYPVVGWLWFLGTLVPVIGVVQVGEQALADRYAYFPSIGLYLVVGFGARDLVARWPKLRAAVVAVAVGTVLLLSIATRRQVGYWRNGETLFRHAIAVTDDNYLAHLNLGSALDQRGDRQAALEEYRAALEIRPDYAHARANLGAVLAESGDLEGATAQLEQALRAQPDHPLALYNLGWIEERRDPAVAAEYYERALAADPDHLGARLNLGVLRAIAGDLDAAAGHFRQALVVQPDDADALLDLGHLAEAYAGAGRIPEARSTAAEAVRRAEAAGRVDLARQLRERLRPLLDR